LTFRIVTTPLASHVPLPVERQGGFPAALLAACVRVPGHDALLDRLLDPQVLVVTTGQQPALFAGPMYTVHKALSAAALAQELERRWKRPVVPLFWIAGDDHDYAEANKAAWLSGGGEVEHGSLAPRDPSAPMRSLYREPLGPDIEELTARLDASLPESEFHAPTMEWVRRHYRNGATISAAFGRALAEILAPFGIVCLDSTHPDFKRAAAPHLLRALALAEELEAGLARRSAELVAGGQDPGVAVGGGATLVMIDGAAGRDRLVRSGGEFVARRSQERFTLSALETVAAREPDRLSANVLLRPAVESALLPTVAYAAGPGELRYLALTPPVYERLGLLRQTPVPRWSGMTVPAPVDRALEKFGLHLGDLAEPVAVLEAKVVRGRLPREAEADLAALRNLLAERYDAVGVTAARIDPTLVRSVGGRRERALAEVDHIERKLVTHLRRRMAVELRQLARAHDAVFPDGAPQERVLVVPSLLAAHGPGLLEALLSAASGWYRGALERSAAPA
jgi:bacillithiol biosynthesis cysteine-adding enzyme BshC